METPTDRFRKVKNLIDQDALLLSIGDVATATGVSTRQIRYWEKKGYINSTLSESGQRKFTYFELLTVGMIQSRIEAGYTLSGAVKEVQETSGVFKELRKFLQERMDQVNEISTGYEFDLGEVEGVDENKHLFLSLEKGHKRSFKVKKCK
ncbi:MerR family transcriptional regulator [Pediococcus argentinicus]|uniref:HTH merR-type domain-containing protein n=1 Tax=Pediococcus argentinicus TaxID=480391 RepID=A0A0R2NCQ8_9LACO|nr:MerR family transcriptional regulator [Pediococcus argentinicus]KRO23678.1 hypothetical protein IV88_GL000887 [Pediococcus argentinicus]NKZ22853.1 MerR family transcriptional regulator [Pediococcus argentinicus]GEP19924.1 MerR family transcriptional regulator [Pediococcus argentinicus]